MKQVYTQQKENHPPSSERSRVRAWVLFIGFLVWLIAVKETFGQPANSNGNGNKTNTRITELSPLAGACSIQVSATLQYVDKQGKYKSFELMQSQQITFRLRDANKVVVASVTGTTDGHGVATAQLKVPSTSVQLEAEYSGNELYKSVSQTGAFTVEDKNAPVVSLKSGVMLTLDGTGKASLSVADVLAAPSTDACGIKSEVLSRTAFDCTSKGSQAVTLTITDINNNVTVRQIAVTVVDQTAPVPLVASLPVLRGECSVKAAAPQALDNCAGLLTAVTSSPLEYTQQGSYTITWKYNDGNGNVTEQQQQVVVKDGTGPVISDVPADLVVAAGANCQAMVNWVAPKATDNCELVSFSSDVAPGTIFGLGTRKVTYTATDKAGNVTKASFLVSVEDNAAPAVVVKNATIYLNAEGKATLPLDSVRVSSTDNCGILAEVLSQKEFTCLHVGSLPVTLTVTDNNGNVTEKTVTVTVAEKVKPVVNTQPVILQLDANGRAALTAAQVDNGSYDNCKIASLELSQYNFSCEHVGVNTVTLTVTDVNGNVNTDQATVTVEDKTAPVVEVRNVTLSLLEDGKAILKIGDVKVSTSDACGISSETLSDTLFSCAEASQTKEVIFTVTDAHGNATHQPVQVKVVDQAQPMVVTKRATLQLDDNGAASLSLEDVLESSSDNCGIMSQVLSKMHFGCENLGENKVILTVTDHSGNATAAEATVTVVDKTAPVIAGMPANLQLSAGANCQATGSWAAPSFSDNCAIKGFTVTHPTGTAFELGVTTVTYTVEDNAGNTQQASFTVTVTNAAPQITQINAPSAPVAVINEVAVSIGFTDNNLASAVIEWGDGSSNTYAAGDANMLSGSHLYTAPGLYTLKVTLIDACGAQASRTYEYIMVNAPTDGFITGGGWINSPAGALVGTTAMGKASYSFEAKYNPATGVSSGSATFEFPTGALSFASTRIDWLVVADSKAWVKGVGTVNGGSGYSFLLSAVDSELNGYRNTDTFRMQIWNQNGTLVYDNQPNAPRNAPAGQMITGGSIVMHKAKDAPAQAASSNRMGADAGQKVSLGLKAYPNPSAGNFTVIANENLTADAQVTVLDLQGQPVYRGVLEAGTRTLEVNLTGKGAGLYMVQVQVAGQRQVLRLVKQ